MKEILSPTGQTAVDEPQLQLAELAAYDAAIAKRINMVELGMFPNGHSPNGVLSEAMKGQSSAAIERFEKEYEWAMALRAFGFSSLEDKPTLMVMADDALFEAGETYDPADEPNFLKHFTKISKRLFESVFERSAPLETPAIEDFDNLVIETHLKDLPPLADERPAVSFHEADVVLVLEGARLLPAVVRAAREYSQQVTLPVITEDIRNELEATIDRLEATGINWEKVLNGCGLRYKGGRPAVDALLWTGVLHHPALPQVVPQPSPGFLELEIEDTPRRLITDMHHNTIITGTEWEPISNDPLYRAMWLEHGSRESLRRQSVLGEAIQDYKGPRPRRATDPAQRRAVLHRPIGSKQLSKTGARP